MNRYSRPTFSFAALAFALAVLPGIAHAYLDPGTGSYILQIVVGALLGGLFAVGIFWRRVIAFVRGLFSRRGGGDGETRS